MGEPGIHYRDYPIETVREMRRLGLPKPQDCHSNQWNSRDEMNHRHETIIELMLAGWPKKRIAETLDFAYYAFIDLTNSETFQAAYKEARKKRRESLDKAVVTALYQDATEVLNKVMMNEDEKGSVRLDAAKYIIDQTVGKPEQKVHQTGSILHEFMSRVEELKSRPVSESPDLLVEPKNAIDTFIDEHVPEGFSVGKRGSTDESQGEHTTDEPESGVPERNLENSDYYS